MSTEVMRFAIDVDDVAAVMHDTNLLGAVPQVEGVAQFVKGFFDGTGVEACGGVRGRGAFSKSLKRDDTGATAKLRFAKDMRQNGDKQVHLGERQYPQRVCWEDPGQFF